MRLLRAETGRPDTWKRPSRALRPLEDDPLSARRGLGGEGEPIEDADGDLYGPLGES